MTGYLGTTATRPLTTRPLTTRHRQLAPYLCNKTTRPLTTRSLTIGTFNDQTSFPGNGTYLLYGLGLDDD